MPAAGPVAVGTEACGVIKGHVVVVGSLLADVHCPIVTFSPWSMLLSQVDPMMYGAKHLRLLSCGLHITLTGCQLGSEPRPPGVLATCTPDVYARMLGLPDVLSLRPLPSTSLWQSRMTPNTGCQLTGVRMRILELALVENRVGLQTATTYQILCSS